MFSLHYVSLKQVCSTVAAFAVCVETAPRNPVVKPGGVDSIGVLRSQSGAMFYARLF